MEAYVKLVDAMDIKGIRTAARCEVKKGVLQTHMITAMDEHVVEIKIIGKKNKEVFEAHPGETVGLSLVGVKLDILRKHIGKEIKFVPYEEPKGVVGFVKNLFGRRGLY